MRKYLVGLIVIGFIGSAAAFPASIEVVDRQATPDDPAEFNVQVENDFAEQRTFRISSISSPPPTGSWFGYSNAQTVDPGEKANFSVVVTPPKTAIQQNYGFKVNLRPLSGDEHEQVSDYFNVNQQNQLTITSTGISGNNFRPGEKLESNVTVFNTAPESVNYRVKTWLMNDSSTKSGVLNSGGQRTHSFSFQIPEGAMPGQYELKTAILRDGQETSSVTQSLEVMSLEDIDIEKSVDDRVLQKTTVLKATNTGNSETRVELNQTFSGYMVPLISFDRAPDRVEETESGMKTYYWNSQLKPGETTAISYKTRYWPPMLLAGLLIVGLVVLKKLYTGVRFTKQVNRKEDEIKIHLEIHNHSGRTLQNVEVTDFVPDIASVKDEFPMAKPIIRKTGEGTRLVWEIEEMAPGEQRVFEYSIKPLLEVEGGVTLPEAELEAGEQRIKQTSEKTVEFKPE